MTTLHRCETKLEVASKYAKRHRICETHLKSLEVLWKGKIQRFCQKCTRFQELNQFDGSRRSCRKGLTLQVRTLKSCLATSFLVHGMGLLWEVASVSYLGRPWEQVSQCKSFPQPLEKQMRVAVFRTKVGGGGEREAARRNLPRNSKAKQNKTKRKEKRFE